ncbi:MAG: type II toxin-antitoxin system HicA family toxin, partial [Actinomycetota bacterium]|nr:type II toxin-antitoxin system HicA family toxin [Actinomycetota bacterium]
DYDELIEEAVLEPETEAPSTYALPIVSSRQLVHALEAAGFQAARKRGGHVAMKRDRPDGRTTTVLVKLGAAAIPRGVLRSILRMAGMSEDEFRDYLTTST